MLPGARTDVRFARSVRAGDHLAEESRYSCYHERVPERVSE